MIRAVDEARRVGVEAHAIEVTSAYFAQLLDNSRQPQPRFRRDSRASDRDWLHGAAVHTDHDILTTSLLTGEIGIPTGSDEYPWLR
jgi:hypothetical protein